MRRPTWLLGIAVAALATAACGSANDPVQPTPTPLPAGLPPNGAAHAIPDSMRPALDALAERLAADGSTLQIPTYLPEELVLTEVGTSDDTPNFRPKAGSLVRGKFVRQRYQVGSQLVFIDLLQLPPSSDDPIIFPPLTEEFRIPFAGMTRIGGFPPGEPDTLRVPEAVFITSFQDNGENFVIEGEAHRCGAPGCFTSWCTTLDCPKFPEPVVRAIINSLEPYAP